MLESIKIRNFKSHEHLDAVFPDGLTICTGSNYRGKSSVLQAILFSFFGVSAVPGGAKLAVRRGSSPSSLSVEANLFHGGHKYQVERTANNAYLRRDGELIASSKSAVNAQLEEILGVPQKFFLRLKYAEQGETQALLTMGAEELHKIVEHVSGASVVNQVIVKASKMSSSANSRLDEIGPVEDVKPLKNRRMELVAERDTIQNSLDQLRHRLEESKSRCNQANATYSEALLHNQSLEKDRERRQLLQTQIEVSEENIRDAQATLTSNQRSASSARQHELEYQEMVEQEQMIARLTDNITRLEQQVYELSGNLEQQETRLKQATALVERAGPAPDIKALQEGMVESERHLSLWQAEVSRLQSTLDNGVCQSCKRPFESVDVAGVSRELKTAKENTGAAQLWAEEKKRLYSEGLKEVTRSQSRVEALQRVKNEVIPALRDQLSASNVQLDQLKKQRRDQGSPPCKEQISRAKTNWLESATASNIVNKAAKDLDTAKQSLEQAHRQLKEMSDVVQNSPIDLVLLHQEYETAQSEMQATQQQVSDTLARRAAHSNLIKEIETRIRAGEAAADRCSELVKERDTSKRLVSYLKTNRDRFMSQLWQQVMGYASDFASECTGGAIEKVVRTDAGTFEFIEQGENLPMAAASGAQKSIMSVGVQLAFDALLPDSFGAVLLDEPTSQMDEDHSLTLTEMLANSGRQIIMVSHREADASLAQAHINLS
jgi:DNA repair exonuclease SbcCD ATPase subunit